MARRARPIPSENPSKIAIGVFEEGAEKPFEVLREPAPEGWSPEQLQQLADYMARGYNAAREEDEIPSLAEFAAPIRGRSINPDVQQIGLDAAKLRATGLTWGEIALRLCAKKGSAGHRCGKKCADRIRQAAKPYLKASTTR